MPPPAFSYDAFFKERGATDMETALMKAYFTLSEQTRLELMEKVYTAVLSVHDSRYQE